MLKSRQNMIYKIIDRLVDISIDLLAVRMFISIDWVFPVVSSARWFECNNNSASFQSGQFGLVSRWRAMFTYRNWWHRCVTQCSRRKQKRGWNKGREQETENADSRGKLNPYIKQFGISCTRQIALKIHEYSRLNDSSKYNSSFKVMSSNLLQPNLNNAINFGSWILNTFWENCSC